MSARYRNTAHCFIDIFQNEGVNKTSKWCHYNVFYFLYYLVSFEDSTREWYIPCLDREPSMLLCLESAAWVWKYFMKPEGGPPTVHHNMLAGGIAGAVQCVICCPMELIKLWMQVQGVGQAWQSMVAYEGPWTTTVKLYIQGGVVALNKGMVSTLYRETLSFGTYFATYDYLCQKIAGNSSVDDLGLLKIMFAGAITGIPTCLVSYIPLMLSNPGSRSMVYTHLANIMHGLVDCFRKSYAERGQECLGVG